MKYGIFYPFWEQKWGTDYHPYIDKMNRLGFDILEISAVGLGEMSDDELKALKDHGDEKNVTFTVGYGPHADQSMASSDPAVVDNGLRFWEAVFKSMKKLDSKTACGGLYGYWPVDYSQPFDKEKDLENSIRNMRRLADIAMEYDVTTLGMESLNRHEGYLINCAREAADYCKAVGRPNVKVHLDTYHMTLEEDSFTEAIHTAGNLLGHLHVGENNRKLPGQGHIINWKEIADALHDIGYDGNVVMEPFVIHGGEVGHDIRIWRDMQADTSEATLDRETGESLVFLKKVFEG